MMDRSTPFSIRPAEPQDKDWITTLWLAVPFFGGSLGLYRAWRSGMEWHETSWLVIPHVAFIHYRIRKADKVRVAYELCVDPAHRRTGAATSLLDSIGTPVTLKTDADNDASNALYRRMGFFRTGTKHAASGKLMNIYFKP